MSMRTEFSASLRSWIATIAMAWLFAVGIAALPARAADADDQAMVDCIVPGQIQRLNNNVVIMGARHPVRATRADCHVRGGEYHDAAPVLVSEADRTADTDRVAIVHHTTRTHHKIHHAAKTVKPSTTK